MRRANNQDAVAVVPESNGQPVTGGSFLMVADGMGAHAAGELASRMAIELVPHAYAKGGGESAPASLRRAVREANARIHAKGSSSDEFLGMGTTCSCLVVDESAALIAHVGDSRVYRLRGGVLEQLTFDHSLVWEMAAASKVSEDKVPACIPKNVITRSLGPHETVMVDLEGPHAVEAGDVFLLCSDGLTGVVDDTLIGGVVGSTAPADAAQTLVDLANLRGGPDNISVVVAAAEPADGRRSKPEKGAPTVGSSAGGIGLAIAVAALCAIGCVWSLGAGNYTGIIVSAVGLGAAVAYAASARPAVDEPSAPRLSGGPYGNGPYRRIECGDRASAAGDLRDLVRELSAQDSDDDTVRPDQSAGANGAPKPLSTKLLIDWAPFQPRKQAADEAFDSGDYTQAVAVYSELIRTVMKAVREDDGTHRYQAKPSVAG